VALMPPSAADVTNTYLYDPYGVTEHQTGTQYNPWQFASGYLDASTLYYKYGTRYYDRFGRWTQKDSQPSANPYLYANDDPVNNVDLSGRSFNPIACSAAIIALGALAKSFSSFLYNAYLSARAAVATAIELAATQPELAPLAADLVIAAVLVFAGAVALIAFATYLLLASACNLPGGNISV